MALYPVLLNILECVSHKPSDQVESKGGRDSGLPQVKLGTKLKAKNGWLDRGSGTDEYGFSAVPAGFRWSNWSQVQDDWDTSPTFFYEGENAFFWTSTSSGLKEMEHEGETVVMESAWYRDIHHKYPAIYRNDCPKNHGNSIRSLQLMTHLNTELMKASGGRRTIAKTPRANMRSCAAISTVACLSSAETVQPKPRPFLDKR